LRIRDGLIASDEQKVEGRHRRASNNAEAG
jgi:hypothetical protein